MKVEEEPKLNVEKELLFLERIKHLIDEITRPIESGEFASLRQLSGENANERIENLIKEINVMKELVRGHYSDPERTKAFAKIIKSELNISDLFDRALNATIGELKGVMDGKYNEFGMKKDLKNINEVIFAFKKDLANYSDELKKQARKGR